MHRYTGYELTVASPVELPAFERASPHAKLDLSEALVFREVSAERMNERFAEQEAGRPDVLVGFYDDVCHFAIIGGRTAEIYRYPGVEDGPLGRCLISLPFAVALRQRGATAFHGCAVGVDGRAVAFVGPSGAGKSTLAEAFFQRGHPVFCDDLLVLRFESGAPEVVPGHTEIRLRPGAGEALLPDFESLPTAYSNTGQRFRDISKTPRERLPLHRIYLLDGSDSAETAIRPTSPIEAYAALASQTWAYQRFQRPEEVALHQERLGALIRGGYVARIERRRTFEALGELIDAVVADVQTGPLR